MLLILMMMVACGSSKEEKKDIKNDTHVQLPTDTTSLTRPSDSHYTTGPVYLETVTTISRGKEMLLMITGMLPDGCSYLYDLKYSITGSDLRLEMTSWRPADAMCTQALVEFTHISDKISTADLQRVTHYVSDGHRSELHSDSRK